MINFGFSMLFYWIAYFLVTAIGILHTIFNIVVLDMKSMKDSPGMGRRQVHLLLMDLVYFRRLRK